MKNKMKNIHILSTDKPSRLRYNLSNVLVLTKEPYRDYSKQVNQNIYITSDEEIKDGEYGLSKLNEIIKFHSGYDYRYYAKIILTTDLELIQDGVQSILDEFLEWFIKNPKCESVEVENERIVIDDINYNFDVVDYKYKIIIPKQESKKVLTEEDIFNQKDIDAVTDYINKEQQKQHLIDMMESDEELGLYEQIDQNNPVTKGSTALVKEIKLEDVFNDKKREKVKQVIHQHKVLKGLSLVNPTHLQMTSNGHGEFPDGYKLTEKGIQYIIEQLNKE